MRPTLVKGKRLPSRRALRLSVEVAFGSKITRDQENQKKHVAM
jgi:hypothetical protein